MTPSSYWAGSQFQLLCFSLAAAAVRYFFISPSPKLFLLVVISSFIITLLPLKFGRRGRILLLLFLLVLLKTFFTTPAESNFLPFPSAERMSGVSGRAAEDASIVSGNLRVIVLHCASLTIGPEMSTSEGDFGELLLYFSAEQTDAIYCGEQVRAGGRSYENEAHELSFFVEKIEVDSKDQSLLLRVRRGIIAYLTNAYADLDPGVQELIGVLILGRKEEPQNPLYRLFREAGTSHLLALSGMHLQFFAMFLLFIGRKLLPHRMAVSMVALFLCVYLWLVGPKPSLVRAVLLFFVMEFFIPKNAPDRLLHGLFAAFLLQHLLLIESAEGAGFLLSYSAVCGIALLHRRILLFLPGMLPSAAAQPIAVSLSAFIGAAPAVWILFGVIRPVGMIASLIMTPLIMGMMICGVLLLIPLTDLFLAEVARLLYSLLRYFSALFSKVPGIEGGVKEAAGVFLLLTFILLYDYLWLKQISALPKVTSKLRSE